jgi:hypothetical protein
MRYTATLVVVALSACMNDVAAPRRPAPTITATLVTANPNNAISAVVLLRTRNSDSAAVLFHLSAAPTAVDSVTPAVLTTQDSAVIPVLGLLPRSRYILRAVVYGSNEMVAADPVTFTTDTLPSDLPVYHAAGADASAGYVVFAAGKYGLVIDNTGRVVWYRRFPDGPGLNFMSQPTGHYVARPPSADTADLGSWLELDALGNVTRKLGCVGNLQSRFHDLIIGRDGDYWIMCDETRTEDLTGEGGVAAARVTGTLVQHVAEGGRLLFQWSAFDHFAITDLDPADRMSPSVNWTHGNALEFDTDGNLLVSFRSLGEITKINVNTGEVMWRMGGRRNEFTFIDSAFPAFLRQHGMRLAAPGTMILLDNVGTPDESRAETYTIDEAARTARLVRAYSATPVVVTQIGGSVQSLAGERTLVSFGTAGRVEEYDTAGRVAWRIEGNAGYVFRAQRIKSLYTPGVGTAR